MAMAVVILMSQPSFGGIVSVETLPADPGPGDSMWLVVGGRLPSSCWGVLNDTRCAPGFGDTVWVHVFTEYPYRPGAACFPLVFAYETECHLGILHPGDYTVIAVEHRSWPWGALDPLQYVGSIHVSGSTPVLPVRWGAIKTKYE
jgi:hypothetical protein